MVPVTVSLGLININAVIDTLFASRLIDPALAPSAIDKAFRIYMLPQGIFSVAVATVLFPSLSRLATRRDIDGFRRTVGLGLRQIAFLLVPASFACAVLAEPIVRLLYQRGEFTASQTTVVADALAASQPGARLQRRDADAEPRVLQPAVELVARFVALGNLALNAVLDWAFYSFGVWGIPLATSLVNIAGTAALLLLLRRRIARIDCVDHGTHARARHACLVCSRRRCVALWDALDAALGRSVGGQFVSLGVALAAGSVAYLLACRALRVHELEALLALRTRFRRV